MPEDQTLPTAPPTVPVNPATEPVGDVAPLAEVITSTPPDPTNANDQLEESGSEPVNAAVSPEPGAVPPNPGAAQLLFDAAQQFEREIADATAGRTLNQGPTKERLVELCRVIDFWLDQETGQIIDSFGLISLAKEIKTDYVTASFLAWRGEFKIAYITLRSFLESFCLLLYYLNQGCDRLLFLRGKGYKLMLHRMAQKRPVPDDMHAFRRHYHLLIEDSYGSSRAADKFFDEIDSCYGVLSKAVHGDYSNPATSPTDSYLNTVSHVLRICNTLALHEPILDVTEDSLGAAIGEVLRPLSFEWSGR